MLGCPDAAQDATQQVFANAYRDLAEGDKELDVKPWLYAIARNHCISILRSRRPESAEVEDVRFDPGVDQRAEGREEIQDLLQDVGALPERQKAAVVMSTLGGFSHGEIATAIGCEAEQVKAILFQARAALSERAEAREASCSEMREQLRVLRGGSLRRNRIRLHLQSCESCRRYREAVRRERLTTSGAVALAPLTWSVGVTKSVLAKLGIVGSGLREAGVAQLAAVALATGAGVVGVATVAPDTDASQSPTPVTVTASSVEGPAVEQPNAHNRAALAPDAPTGHAEGNSAGSGGPLSGLLSGLLSEEGLLDLSHLLGKSGLVDLDVVGTVSGSNGALRRERGSRGNAHPGDVPQPAGPAQDSDADRGLLSLLLGGRGCQDRDRD